jgi:hypothetical protein
MDGVIDATVCMTCKAKHGVRLRKVTQDGIELPFPVALCGGCAASAVMLGTCRVEGIFIEVETKYPA